MAHAANTHVNIALANFAALIPGKEIIAFMEENLDLLPTLAECEMSVEEIPLASFDACYHPSLVVACTGSVCPATSI